MKKDFKIARKPGQPLSNAATPVIATNMTEKTELPVQKKKMNSKPIVPPKIVLGVTTRKTIEVPEEYFYQVKMRALERRILEKDLWAEILAKYFSNHPTL